MFDRFAQPLESRTLMSASAAASPAVRADRLQVRADLLQFRADLTAASAGTLADVTALRAAGLKSDAAVLPLVKAFRADVATMRHALFGDRLNEATAVLSDEVVIVKELKQAFADRGNATAEAADKAQLLTDRVKLQADEVAGLDSRVATRTGDLATITAAAAAIVTAANADPTASAALKGGLQKFTADRTAALPKLTADLMKVATDRQQLITDLSAG